MPLELREEISEADEWANEKRRQYCSEEMAVHSTLRNTTEGEARMMADRTLALCDVIEHPPRGKEESD